MSYPNGTLVTLPTKFGGEWVKIVSPVALRDNGEEVEFNLLEVSMLQPPAYAPFGTPEFLVWCADCAAVAPQVDDPEFDEMIAAAIEGDDWDLDDDEDEDDY